MKIKPLHIYLFVAVAAIIVLVIVANQSPAPEHNHPLTEQMPEDDIHKGLGKEPGKGNVSESVKHQMDVLKKQIEDNPNDTAKIKEYADFMAAAHKPDEALIYYKRILDVNPKRTDVLFSMAYVYYGQQEYLKTEEVTKRILEIDPQNHEAFYNLGAIAATKGETEEAKKIWNKLIKDYPSSASAKSAEDALKRL